MSCIFVEDINPGRPTLIYLDRFLYEAPNFSIKGSTLSRRWLTFRGDMKSAVFQG